MTDKEKIVELENMVTERDTALALMRAALETDEAAELRLCNHCRSCDQGQTSGCDNEDLGGPSCFKREQAWWTKQAAALATTAGAGWLSPEEAADLKAALFQMQEAAKSLGEEADRLQTRRFPIQGGPSIPWSVIAPCEAQALRNHGQTLERLAQRSGLGPREAIAVLTGRKYFDAYPRGGPKEGPEDVAEMLRIVNERQNLVSVDECERRVAEATEKYRTLIAKTECVASAEEREAFCPYCDTVCFRKKGDGHDHASDCPAFSAPGVVR